MQGSCYDCKCTVKLSVKRCFVCRLVHELAAEYRARNRAQRKKGERRRDHKGLPDTG